MCLIRLKYRIIILIIIIISLGKILSSYIANTSRTHTYARAHSRARTPHALRRWSLYRCAHHDYVMVGRTLPDAGETMADRRLIEINYPRATLYVRVFFLFAYTKILGRTETQTRDRIYCHAIRSVRDIYRDDRARIATCTLRTLTDRHKENYSIDTLGPVTSIIVAIIEATYKTSSFSMFCDLYDIYLI